MLKNKSLRTRRFVAKYIGYIELFGYLFVAALAAAIFAAWFFHVDDTVRHDGDPEIRPKETAVKNKEDAYITRFFVTEKFQPVRKGQPLVEIVDDPQWVERLRAVGHLKRALADWTALEERLGDGRRTTDDRRPTTDQRPTTNDQRPPDRARIPERPNARTPNDQHPTPNTQHPAPGPPSPLAAPDLHARNTVEQALTQWDQSVGSRAPRRVLRAGDDGVVVFDEKLPGQVVAKDKEIAKVADFDELQVKVKLKGEHIPDVRVGQLAQIRVRPNLPPGRTLRGDREGFLWNARRVEFRDPVDEPMKNWLRDELKKQPVTTDEDDDIPFPLDDLEKVEVIAKLKTTPVAPAPITPDPKDRLRRYTLPQLDLRGRVTEAKHTGKISLNELPPPVRRDLEARLLEKVHGKIVDDPEPFRIDGFRSMTVILTAKVETEKTPRNEREREKQLENSLVGNKVERFVFATVALDSPPPELTEAIKAQYMKDKPSGPRVDVDVVTDRRRFAMQLFRQ